MPPLSDKEKRARTVDRHLDRIAFGEHRMALLHAVPEFTAELAALRDELLVVVKQSLKGGVRLESIDITEVESVQAFELRWRVTVEADLLSQGTLELRVLDDYCGSPPALLSDHVPAWVEKNLRREPSRYVLVDRRAPRVEIDECLDTFLPRRRRGKQKWPLTVEPEDLEQDLILVRAQPRTGKDFEDVAALWNVNLAKGVGYEKGRGADRNSTNLSIMQKLDLWDNRVRRVKGRRKALKKVISPT